MVGSDAEVGGGVRNVAGRYRPVLPGITGGLEFVDSPGHAPDLARYRARGCVMQGYPDRDGPAAIGRRGPQPLCQQCYHG